MENLLAEGQFEAQLEVEPCPKKSIIASLSAMTSRLIVASTRLPITLEHGEEGWRATESTGGLVTALASIREKSDFSWLGWPGLSVPDSEQKPVTQVLQKHKSTPIFIDPEHMEGFYEGFSNEVLWPLFHNFTERTHFSRENWNSYVHVNQQYADAIAAQARPGDLIWIHDYQLCLVPQMLREKGLGCPIGFFLHIPFPSADTYRTLPVADLLLRGLLGADLIGFHTYEYVSHFRMACLRVLGMDSDVMHIGLQSRQVELAVLPIGIDPEDVKGMLRTPEARREQTELERTFAGKHIIVGVDRLDYTKGIPQKLLAFEELLETHPEWRENVVFVQVAAPSRTGVEEYQQLKREVDEYVGRINGKYSTPSHTPVVYVNQSISRVRLAGLYRAAEIALVTPLRDGMNLVALEYVAARAGRGGTLILSEFAGAAHCLPGSRLVNPFNISQVAHVLADSLENDGPHLDTFSHMQKFVEENTSMQWAQLFLDRLSSYAGNRPQEAKLLSLQNTRLASRIKRARQPLIFLDYDGTLRSYVINPKEAVPDQRILGVLQELGTLATVYVVSGRDGGTLESWLGHLPIGLVCEHGLAIKPPGGSWEGRRNVSGSALTRLVRPIFEEFVSRTPGSSIEVKDAAIAWHTRAADPEYSAFQSKELLTRLEDLLKRRPYKVLRGNRVIEVRHEHVTKGNAVGHLLERYTSADLLFCAGDDRTDEDMMAAIPESWRERTITCWVGSQNVHADYWKESSAALLTELETMVELLRGRKTKRLPEPPNRTGQLGSLQRVPTSFSKSNSSAPRGSQVRTPKESTTRRSKKTTATPQTSSPRSRGDSKTLQ